MKMAKADKAEWSKAITFINDLEMEIKYPAMTNEELGKWARKAPCLFRVVAGYQVLVDNAADPNLDYLEFKPEIKTAMKEYAALIVIEKAAREINDFTIRFPPRNIDSEIKASLAALDLAIRKPNPRKS